MKTTNPVSETLRRLAFPGSVAIVGASARKGSQGEVVLQNLKEQGFAGSVYAVNPGHDYVGDLKCYPTLEELPECPDTVVLCISREKVPSALQSAADLGVRGAVVLASGFGETASGKAAEQNLRELQVATGMRIAGPNCLGLVNVWQGATLYSAPLPTSLRRGNVGLVSQTGSGCIGFAATGRVGFSFLLSTGNEAAVDAAEWLNFLVSDENTKVITLILEAVRDTSRFAEAANRAKREGKPVVVLKLGRSSGGSEATATHTGALAGNWATYEAFFRKCGCIVVDDMDELIETAVLLSVSRRKFPGRRVGLLTLSGGESALLCDLIADSELEIPPLDPKTEERLRLDLPDFAYPRNPLDVTGVGVHDVELYRRCFWELYSCDSIDIIAVAQDAPPQLPEAQVRTYAALAQSVAERTGGTPKPVVYISNFGQGIHPIMDATPIDDVPFLQGARESIKAIERVAAHAVRSEGVAHVPISVSESEIRPSPAELTAIRDLLRSCNSGPANGDTTRRLLKAYGIPMVKERLCNSAADAVVAARTFDYPLVAKIESQGASHKAALGLVQLNIISERHLHVAAKELSQNAEDAGIEGQLWVQEMIQNAVEVIIGLRYHPPFGRALVLGVGGSFVETRREIATELLPVNSGELDAAIHRTSLGDLLRAAGADVTELLDLLSRVLAMLDDCGDLILEMDLNPVLVRPAGEGAFVVDTVIMTGLAQG